MCHWVLALKDGRQCCMASQGVDGQRMADLGVNHWLVTVQSLSWQGSCCVPMATITCRASVEDSAGGLPVSPALLQQSLTQPRGSPLCPLPSLSYALPGHRCWLGGSQDSGTGARDHCPPVGVQDRRCPRTEDAPNSPWIRHCQARDVKVLVML